MDTGAIKVLLLSALKPQTGNNSTAYRIRDHLSQAGYICTPYNASDITSTDHFLQLVEDVTPDVIIGIHAFRAGKWLIGSPVPYCIVFGGTDVNMSQSDPDKLSVMIQAVHGARSVVAFSESVLTQAAPLMTFSENKIVEIIPQAVTTSPLVGAHAQTCLGGIPVPKACHMVTIVGGIRPVKDQMYVLSAFSEWYKNGNQDVILVIVGPVLNTSYAEKLQIALERCHGVYFIGGRSLEEIHTIIKASTVLVNSSLSEGQAAAILEAMMLGTCVLVRDIPANTSLVQHRDTGLVYSSPQECIKYIDLLIKDAILRQTLVKNATEYVQSQHSLEQEGQRYAALVGKIMESQPSN